MPGTHDRNRHRDILARSADSGIDMQAEDHFDAVRSVVTMLCSVSLSAEYVAEAANRSCCEIFDSLGFRSAQVGSILQLVYQTTARTIDQVEGQRGLRWAFTGSRQTECTHRSAETDSGVEGDLWIWGRRRGDCSVGFC